MVPTVKQLLALSLMLLTLIPAGAAASSGIQAALGDVIPLSGYATGGPYVYLYLTGPNLPANGVMLSDITRQADQGFFTKVQLDSNDHWSYKWSTSNVGGRLDEGTYTIWVVNGPNDVAHLSQADYSTISVTLRKPGLSVDTPMQAGSMEITSSPEGASVTVNGTYRGKTPFTVSNLPPGTYRLTLTKFGYQEFSTPVEVVSGRVSEITATLAARTDIPTVTTAPIQPLPTPSATAVPPATSRKAAGLLPATFLAGILLLAGKRILSR